MYTLLESLAIAGVVLALSATLFLATAFLVLVGAGIKAIFVGLYRFVSISYRLTVRAGRYAGGQFVRAQIGLKRLSREARAVGRLAVARASRLIEQTRLMIAQAVLMALELGRTVAKARARVAMRAHAVAAQALAQKQLMSARAALLASELVRRVARTRAGMAAGAHAVAVQFRARKELMSARAVEWAANLGSVYVRARAQLAARRAAAKSPEAQLKDAHCLEGVPVK